MALSRMVSPISLRLRSAELVRQARETIARTDEAAKLKRRARLAGLKALLAAQKAFDLQEQAFPRMSEIDQMRWREQYKSAEKVLRQIAKGQL